MTLSVEEGSRLLPDMNGVVFQLYPRRNPRPKYWRHRISATETFRIFRIMDLSPLHKQDRLLVRGFEIYGVVRAIHEEVSKHLFYFMKSNC